MIPTVAIQLLNTLGLGALAAGLVILYKAMSSRSDTLKASLIDLKSAHDSIVAVMERRAKQIDERFEDEKKFQTLHMSFLEEVDVLRVRVKAWREDELSKMHEKFNEMSNRIDTLETESKELRIKNNDLGLQVGQLESKCKFLEKQNTELLAQLGFAQPGVRGVV